MSKIIINGKSDGSLKAYVNGNEVNGVMAGGSRAYTRMETGGTPAEPSYLCFTAQEAGSTVAFQPVSSPVIVPVLYTSTDGNNWSSWDGSAITLANIGDKVYVYGENSRFCDLNGNVLPSKYWHYVMTGSIAASGDATSMLTKNGTTTLDDYAMSHVFRGCASLTTAPELPATTLASGCYYYMFYGCTSLTTAPALSATTLAKDCYYHMFYGCTSLTTAPALPATTLVNRCYGYMFYGCTSLTTAPALPAETLADYCYQSMFYECTSLTTAPALPAETLASSCYNSMFRGCTSLTTAPALPAETLADSCYQSMFRNCTAITTAPALTATTLAISCYNQMFQECTSLTTAPALPAETLASSCYNSMFRGCTSLTTAPELPATTLGQACYSSMFYGCTSLTTAPELPATTLASNCYYQMFDGCTSLNHIEVSATEWNTSYATNWVRNVAATGTFVNNEGITIPVATNGIPSGWTETGPKLITISGAGDTGYTYQIGSGQPQTVSAGSGDVAVKVPDGSPLTLTPSSASSLIYSDNYEMGTTVTIQFADIVNERRFECWAPDTNYLCLTANEANSTVGMAKQNTGAIDHTLYISTDGNTWTQWDYSTVTLANIGDKLYVKGDGNKSLRGTTATATYYYFTMGGSIAASGDVTTLLTTKPQPQMETYTFEYLFKNCTALTTAPSLPATTLENYCYNYMFQGCTGLTTAPTLPATTLANSCYYQMFYGCKSLTTAPTLPATTLEINCYAYMFRNCIGLTEGVDLRHVTTTASGCCSNMYNGCTSLATAYAPDVDTWTTTQFANWLQYVGFAGTLYATAQTAPLIPLNATNGCPSGWTVATAS